MTLTQLALRRAGAASLEAFQQQEGLTASGIEDVETMQRLMPYLLGYYRRAIQTGDTLEALARENDISLARLRAANPALDPQNLQIGAQLRIPLPFAVVPTDVPFTSQLLELCVRGLAARYPFLMRQTIASTAFGRPVTLLRIGQGTQSVLYNASHHANEWITTPLVMQFIEEYALAVVENRPIYGLNARRLYERTQLYLVPMVNPDGVDLLTGAIAADSFQYAQAESIARDYPEIPFPSGWKANLMGVDLNLNYPAGWTQARENKAALGITAPAPRDFVGWAPLDQPETIAMVALTQRVNPRLTLSFHMQGEVIYWKYLDQEPPLARVIGERFSLASGYLLEDTPFASGFAGYKDWYIQEYDRPGYTIEAGLGENPLPLAQFQSIYERILGILVLGLSL